MLAKYESLYTQHFVCVPTSHVGSMYHACMHTVDLTKFWLPELRISTSTTISVYLAYTMMDIQCVVWAFGWSLEN